MHYRLLLIVLSFLLYNCSGDELASSSLNTFKIDINNLIDVSPNDIFEESSSFIPLELNRLSPLRMIYKLLIIDDKLYIFDPVTKGILSFDSEGSFVQSIGLIGYGPGEIPEISDMFYNESTSELELLSPTGKIVSYHLESESYKDKDVLPITSSIHNFAHIDELIVAHSRYDPNQFLIYSEKDKKVFATTERNQEYNRKFRVKSSFSPLYIYDRSIRYFDFFSMSISEINSSSITKKSNFDFDDNNFDPEKFTFPSGSSLIEETKRLKLAFPCLSFVEADIFYFLTVKLGDEILSLVIDKDSKKVFRINLGEIIMPVVHFDGTYFYALLGNQELAEKASNTLIRDAISYDFSEGKNSNPVIYKFKLSDDFLSQK